MSEPADPGRPPPRLLHDIDSLLSPLRPERTHHVPARRLSPMDGPPPRPPTCGSPTPSAMRWPTGSPATSPMAGSTRLSSRSASTPPCRPRRGATWPACSTTCRPWTRSCRHLRRVVDGWSRSWSSWCSWRWRPARPSPFCRCYGSRGCSLPSSGFFCGTGPGVPTTPIASNRRWPPWSFWRPAGG